LKTEGSTRPGPGFSRKVRGWLIENQIRPPAMCGIVAVTVEPGAPRGMEMLAPRGWPVEEGEAG